MEKRANQPNLTEDGCGFSRGNTRARSRGARTIGSRRGFLRNVTGYKRAGPDAGSPRLHRTRAGSECAAVTAPTRVRTTT